MTKLELEAIRALPESMIVDGVVLCEFNGKVVLAERNSIPLMYDPATKEWVKFNPDRLTPPSSGSKS